MKIVRIYWMVVLLLALAGGLQGQVTATIEDDGSLKEGFLKIPRGGNYLAQIRFLDAQGDRELLESGATIEWLFYTPDGTAVTDIPVSPNWVIDTGSTSYKGTINTAGSIGGALNYTTLQAKIRWTVPTGPVTTETPLFAVQFGNFGNTALPAPTILAEVTPSAPATTAANVALAGGGNVEEVIDELVSRRVGLLPTSSQVDRLLVDVKTSISSTDGLLGLNEVDTSELSDGTAAHVLGESSADGVKKGFYFLDSSATEGDVPALSGGFWVRETFIEGFTAPPDGYLYVVVMGQSNAVGRGDAPSFLPFVTNANAEIWNITNQAWEQIDLAVKGTQYPPAINGGGDPLDDQWDFWLPMAYYLHQNYGVKCRFILSVENGRPIDRFNTPTATHFVQLRDEVIAAGIPRVDAAIYAQGESNAGFSEAQFRTAFAGVYANFKSLAGWSADSIMVTYEIPDNTSNETRDINGPNAFFRSLNHDGDPQTASVPIGSLSTRVDEIHYDTSSLIEGGRLLGAAITRSTNPYVLAAQKQGLYQDDFAIVDSTGVTRYVKDSITPLTLPEPLLHFDARDGVTSTGEGAAITEALAELKPGNTLAAAWNIAPLDYTNSLRMGDATGNANNKFRLSLPLARNAGKESFTMLVHFSRLSTVGSNAIFGLFNITFRDGSDAYQSLVSLAQNGQNGSLLFQSSDFANNSTSLSYGGIDGAHPLDDDFLFVLRFESETDTFYSTLINDNLQSIYGDQLKQRHNQTFAPASPSPTNELLRFETGFWEVDLHEVKVWRGFMSDKILENLIDSHRNLN